MRLLLEIWDVCIGKDIIIGENVSLGNNGLVCIWLIDCELCIIEIKIFVSSEVI